MEDSDYSPSGVSKGSPGRLTQRYGRERQWQLVGQGRARPRQTETETETEIKEFQPGRKRRWGRSSQ